MFTKRPGRTAHQGLLRIFATLSLIVLCWMGASSLAGAQVYMGDTPPTEPGLYYMGVMDVNGYVYPNAASSTPGQGLVGDVFLSIGSSAGDHVIVNYYDFTGGGVDFYDYTSEWDCVFFGCLDMWEFLELMQDIA